MGRTLPPRRRGGPAASYQLANALDRFTARDHQPCSEQCLPRPAIWQRRLAALLEVVGIFVTGTLLARFASHWLNLGPVNLRALAPGEPPDFIALSWSTAANLVLRYGFIFGLALAVGWWHRRRRLRDYGVTTAGRPVREYVMIGVLLFAAFGLPPLFVKLLAGEAPLGESPQHWALIQNLDRPGVWLYLAVGSFGLVPIMEELFFRGYVQTRLAEDFGASAAIVTASLFFAFSHTQYFIAGPIGAGMVASLFIESVGIGYARHRTGSLLPGIIAHASGNLPFRGWVELTVLALMVVFDVVRRRVVAEYAKSPVARSSWCAKPSPESGRHWSCSSCCCWRCC